MRVNIPNTKSATSYFHNLFFGGFGKPSELPAGNGAFVMIILRRHNLVFRT